MNSTNPLLITKMRMNKREVDHKSRDRHGFGVYLSRFFYEFNQLPLEEQHAYIFKKDKVRFGRFKCGDSDDRSIDSTDSFLTEKVPRVEIHRSACRFWKYNMRPIIKKAWRKRATQLNARKLPGRFLAIPFLINNREEDSVKKRVMESLSYEWDAVVQFFRNCITRQPRKEVSSMVYTFGNEKVHIHSQTYREFRFSYLLEITIFGRDFSNMKRNELISNTKKQVLLHVSSQNRMKKLFSKEELNATEFVMEKDDSKYVHTCCAKVNIIKNGRNIIGYILNESRGKWKILLSNNTIIYKSPVKYNFKKKEYIYNGDGEFVISYYWPIRILVRKQGRGIRITFNRLAIVKHMKDDYEIIYNKSS